MRVPLEARERFVGSPGASGERMTNGSIEATEYQMWAMS